MTHKTIEFEPSRNSSVMETEPWKPEKTGSYQDNLLKPEYAARKLKFPVGDTWFRILPALRGSRNWMLWIHALNYQDGKHAHPKTLDPREKSVFDKAYKWFKHNRPEALYSKSHKDGYRLLSDPVCLFWILVQEGDRIVSRLVIASGYDGSRGGTPGLGYQIWKLAHEREDNNQIVDDPLHPDEGVQVCIKRIQPQGSRYPSYVIRKGRAPVSIHDLLSKMNSSEIDAINKLEEVVHIPDAEEEWGILSKFIDLETVTRIREAEG